MVNTFSIIVPSYNRPDHLRVCLQSLTRLLYPNEYFEVIVVDDGSSIPLKPVVASFNPRLRVTLIRQDNNGPATARNVGAAHAKGDYLVFTDDDCLPAPDWLQRLADQFAATPDHMIGGQTLNALPKNLYSVASQQLISYLYGYYNFNSNGSRFFTSNNLAVSAEGFQSVGGFDTSFPLAAGEDREFCDCWLSHGYQMTYVPEALVYHAHDMSLGRFWRQHFNYGQGAYFFHQRRACRKQGQIRLEPLSFYLNLLRYPFSQSRDIRAFFVTLMLLCSQVANVLGYFWRKRIGYE